MSTQALHFIDLEREALRTLQDSLSNQLALNINGGDQHEAIAVMGDNGKLAYLAWLLNRSGSMEARVKAAALVEKLAATDREATMKWAIKAATSSAGNGVVSGLFRLLREGEKDPRAEKASLSALAALYQGAGAAAEIKLLIGAEKSHGGLAALIEGLPGARRAKAERVLTVLNAISLDAEGQAALREHALTIPALIRSLLVFSALSNELAISVLYVLTKAGPLLGGSHDSLLVEEAAHLGLAQKLLVIAQMETNLSTKQKIRDLLKAMKTSKCLSSLYGSQML